MLLCEIFTISKKKKKLRLNFDYSYKIQNVACLLNARIVKPEKQLLLGNNYVTRNNAVTVRSCVL
jgi:hypothetical protein